MHTQNPTDQDQYESYLYQLMVKAIIKTEEAERLEQLEIWCGGNRVWHKKFCEERDITPIALFMAAMIECEHPLICKDGMLKFTLDGCGIEILKVELRNQVLPMPNWTYPQDLVDKCQPSA